ncbi:MAG: multicopper oxidase family protein [Solirubrobacterales bacterium]
MLTRRGFLRLTAAAGIGGLLPWRIGNGRAALASPMQVPLDPSAIPKFVDALPSLDVLTADSARISLQMREFLAPVLPSSFVPSTGTYAGTWVWGYLQPGQETRTSYLGPVIVARRGVPTEIEWLNDLGDTSDTHIAAFTSATDQTLHWADPLNGGASACAERVEPSTPPTGLCAEHYGGPIPGVTHLHGGEVPSKIDGGPDAWFTSDGAYRGHAYYSRPGHVGNGAIYRYPNSQEAAPLWFHDHVLGLTRLNVYAGLAGAYLLTDPDRDRTDLPAPIPLVIQDRMFDVDGQLFFPSGIPYIPNPEHPFWVPEFIGDTIVVNGKVWPYLEVEPKRYRFIVLNGSNARAYELFLVDPASKRRGPAMWQIGTDGGYLDVPVRIDPNASDERHRHLLLMPGERADVIVDFAGVATGTQLLLRNVAPVPYPSGDPVDPATTGKVLRFRVTAGSGSDPTYDPASGEALRRPMVRLVDPTVGTVARGVVIHRTRLLTLNEAIGEPSTYEGVEYPGGPFEILVNNSEYTGESGRTYEDFTPITVGGVTRYYSELPDEGSTEIWELVNLTADAHPIHLHLVQFQILDRRSFDLEAYEEVYEEAFPGGTDPMGGQTYPPGVFVPGFGPPLDYRAERNPLSGGKDGGNPDVTPYLRGRPRPPRPNEVGWKDTVRVPPGSVTRIVVRWAPTHLRRRKPKADAWFPFDPDGGHGYVWHCHILDHEDNEMMRPTSVQANPNAMRTYVEGPDF